MMIIKSNVPVTMQPRTASLKRISRTASPYVVVDGQTVAPVTYARGSTSEMQRNFSAQLLEIGLRNHLNALLNMADDDTPKAAKATPHDKYDEAQSNFADPHLVKWRV